MSELTLLRVLKLGARGKDVRAMKRGLARAGHGNLAGAMNPLMGPFAVTHVKNFQRKHSLEPTGAYGKETHARLIQFFDPFAIKLYKDARWEPKDPHPPAKNSLQLPKDFSSTHETAGLSGFPAVDVFADPNTVVLAPEDGVIDKLSGHDPKEGGPPGGPYGFSIYLSAASGRYFMTHFATRQVALQARVTRGQPIGTVCDSAVSGKPHTSHIHVGKHRG